MDRWKSNLKTFIQIDIKKSLSYSAVRDSEAETHSWPSCPPARPLFSSLPVRLSVRLPSLSLRGSLILSSFWGASKNRKRNSFMFSSHSVTPFDSQKWSADSLTWCIRTNTMIDPRGGAARCGAVLAWPSRRHKDPVDQCWDVTCARGAFPAGTLAGWASKAQFDALSELDDTHTHTHRDNYTNLTHTSEGYSVGGCQCIKKSQMLRQRRGPEMAKRPLSFTVDLIDWPWSLFFIFNFFSLTYLKYFFYYSLLEFSFFFI